MFNAKEITLMGIAIALVYVATAFVNVKLPIASQGGLIHLGNVPLFIFAILFGKKVGAVAGAFGMGIFDLLSGWTLWAPFTFVIVGAMGYAVGLITEKHKSGNWYLLAFIVAGTIKLGGYYIAEGCIYGNWYAPIASVPGNFFQILLAALITRLLIDPLWRSIKPGGSKKD